MVYFEIFLDENGNPKLEELASDTEPSEIETTQPKASLPCPRYIDNWGVIIPQMKYASKIDEELLNTIRIIWRVDPEAGRAEYWTIMK
jgi:hypothetical protein